MCKYRVKVFENAYETLAYFVGSIPTYYTRVRTRSNRCPGFAMSLIHWDPLGICEPITHHNLAVFVHVQDKHTFIKF